MAGYISAPLLRRQATEALNTRAVLDADRNGFPILKGQKWHGRAAMWLKDHFVPGHRRGRRQRIHHLLGGAITQAYRNQKAAQKPRGLLARLRRQKAPPLTTRPPELGGGGVMPARLPVYARSQITQENYSHVPLREVVLMAAKL